MDMPALRGTRWGPQKWLHIALVAVLAALYLAFVVAYVRGSGLFDYIAADYRVFRASADIALHEGMAPVYDLAVQERYQRPLYDAYATGPGRAAYATIPMPYLPVFVYLFVPLLLLEPLPGLLAWTALNAALLGLYLWRLWRALPGPVGWGPLAAALLCYPLFLNFFLGQVNVLLLICLGEFLLAGRREQGFRAGLWLAGLLLKPQALFPLLPGLLIARRWKTLAGFVAAALPVAGLSLFLAGAAGPEDIARLLLRYTGELATTVPALMMNWRSLGVNLETFLPAPLAWGLAIAGLALSAAAALSLWVRPAALAGRRWGLAVLGTYAATCAVAWHAHIHMALPLLAPLLLLHAQRQLSRAALETWAAAPALLFFAAALFLPAAAPNLAGLGTLAVNLALLAWAVRSFWRADETPSGKERQVVVQ